MKRAIQPPAGRIEGKMIQKKKRVVLVSPPLYGVDMPPLGLAYVAGRLLADGFDVKVFCLNSELYAGSPQKRSLWDWEKSTEWASIDKIAEHFDVWALLEDWSKRILEYDPLVLGMSVNNHSLLLAHLLAAQVKKKKNLPIIFGGPGCSEVSGERMFQSCVDVYVRGEGEGIASSLVKVLDGGGVLDETSLPGTVVLKKGVFEDFGWDANPLPVNEIPFPALSLFDFDRYTNREEIPILLSRGCQSRCRFCTDKPMWGRFRMRSAGNIADEMVQHAALFGRQRFKCNDLMVNGDVKGLEMLADEIERRGAKVYWGGMARARADISDELYAKLKRSGCEYLTYGIESGARRVLAHMGKPSKKDIAVALKRTSRAGIKVNTLWMVGYPVETWSDLLETVFFLWRHKRWIHEFVAASACYLPRHSWLWEQQEALGIKFDESGDWFIANRNTSRIRVLRRKILLLAGRLIGLYKGGIR